jgi:hypothetical protein
LKLIGCKDTILVQVKLSESVTKDHLFCLSTREIEKFGAHSLSQVLDLFSADSSGLILADVPDGLHHLDKVLIGWRRHGQVSVIVFPFLLRDCAVVVTSHAIEAIQEILQNLLPRLLSIDEVLVLGHVVYGVDIVNADSAIVASVDKIESLVDHVHTALVQGVPKTTDKLLVGDVAIAIHIVEAHECLNLDDLGEQAIGSERLRELSLVKLTVAIVVHTAEDDAKRANTDSTSLLDLHLELIVNAADFDVKTNAVKLRHSLWELQKLIIIKQI